MSYQEKEESVQDGQPVELYLFTNIEEEFAYTSGQNNFDFQSRTYIPRSIIRNQPTRSSIEQQQPFSMSMPANDPFVTRYVATLPATPDAVKIFRFHTTDLPTPEVITQFTGKVSTVSFQGDTADITLVPNSDSLRQQIPRQSCRALCNHILYNDRCLVIQPDFTIDTVVNFISQDGLSVQLSGGVSTVPDTGLQLSAQLAADSAYFDKGVISRGGIEKRMVQTITDLGANIALATFSYPFQELDLGTAVQLSAGCDHQTTTCISKFNNIDRYGGFPYIPAKNPFEVGVDN